MAATAADVFVVPAPESEKPENRFHFKLGRKTYSVPFFQFLGPEAVTWFELNGRTAQEFTMVRQVIPIECPESKEAIRGLSADQAVALSEAWTKASKVTPGKSSASDDS